jgi:hypothetical protein
MPQSTTGEQSNFNVSDNPMDTNFGGPQYARQQVASGKYSGDNVAIYVNSQ